MGSHLLEFSLLLCLIRLVLETHFDVFSFRNRNPSFKISKNFYLNEEDEDAEDEAFFVNFWSNPPIGKTFNQGDMSTARKNKKCIVLVYTVCFVRWDTYYLANRVEHQKLNQTTAELPFG